MRKLILALLTTTTLAGAPSLLAAEAEEKFPGIRTLMNDEQFNATGLDKLSPEELKALDAWLLRYTAGEAQELLLTNDEVQEVEEQIEEDFVLNAKIKPPFSGWRGDTVFYLDNGQIWRQRLSGKHFYSGDETDVVIKKNFFGFYVLTLTATGKSVGVTRVK